jgi:hypothetical protein
VIPARIAFTFFLTISVAASAQDVSRWHEVSGGAWQVSPLVVVRIAPLLQAAANQEYEDKNIQAPNLESYTIQYQGTESGLKRVVSILGACEVRVPSDLLTRQWYQVFDGGECFFEATYDPESKKLTEFFFHGRA